VRTIRIVKRMAGILDGHSLSAFVPGDTYDLDDHFALQLIDLGGAIDVPISPLFPADTADDMHLIDGGVRITRRARQEKKRRTRKTPKKR
jgi:hypothetical protein